MSKEKKSVQLYYDYIDILEELDDKQFRSIINSMVEYDKSNIILQLDNVSKIAFKFIQKRIDYDRTNYDDKCNKNKENISKYWEEQKNKINTNVYERKPMNTKRSDIDIELDIDIDNNKKKYIKKKFGIYKRISLTDNEYSKLCLDFTKDVIDNQITLLDEYVQSNNNKNKYTDFNLVLRKSLKDNWFTKTSEFKKKETFDEILDRASKSVEERNKL